MIHKTLTVGFSDLDGFIKLIELVGEEKAIKSLFIKFKEIEKIIDSKNGEIRKIIEKLGQAGSFNPTETRKK